MDKLLDSFPLGLLIRSVFSGAFFVLSFDFAAPEFLKFNSDYIFDVGLPFSLIAGVTVYGLHRSLVYPWIEWAFNAQWAIDWRNARWTLISFNSIRNLAKIWDSKSEKCDDKALQRGKQIATWADFTHLQYVSAWCILCGMAIGFIASFWSQGHCYCRCPILYFFCYIGAMIFLAAAVISNWRLFAVLHYIDLIAPIKVQTNETS